MAELRGRQVDRHPAQLQALLLPGLQLGDRLFQHPGADAVDIAGILRDGDELDRRDGTELRVLPTQQRLGADDRLAVQ